MIPIIIASVASQVAGQVAARNPNIGPVEVPKDQGFDWGGFWLMAYCIGWCCLMTAPWAVFIFGVIKFMFAKRGITWP